MSYKVIYHRLTRLRLHANPPGSCRPGKGIPLLHRLRVLRLSMSLLLRLVQLQQRGLIIRATTSATLTVTTAPTPTPTNATLALVSTTLPTVVTITYHATNTTTPTTPPTTPQSVAAVLVVVVLQ
jgi:hypothetical protein